MHAGVAENVKEKKGSDRERKTRETRTVDAEALNTLTPLTHLPLSCVSSAFALHFILSSKVLPVS